MNWNEVIVLPVKKGDQPSEIIPQLYLSGHPARFGRFGPANECSRHPSKYVHDTYNVKLIVNCCAPESAGAHMMEDLTTGVKRPCVDEDELPPLQHVRMLNIAALDEPSYNLYTHFPTAVKIMSAVIQDGGGVLVHCQMGVSRSASVVAAFLVHQYKAPLEKVIPFMEERRSCVSPNPGFLRQLEKWQQDVLPPPV
eukprot:PhF_6_TR419/c0_g1_i1/m.134